MLPSAPPAEGDAVDPMGDAYLAGYQNCIAIASNYLMDSENMSHDDPLIMGLVQYLEDRQQQRYLQYMLAQCNSNLSGDISDSDLHDLSNRTLDADEESRTSLDVFTNCGQCEQNTLALPPMSEHMDIPDTTRLEFPPEGFVQPLTSSPRNSEVGSSLVSLAHLVQSNPAIANLTEEIISLMNEEEYDDEEDYDNHQNISEADSGINESV